jgi:hypothetical protein
VNKKEKTDYIVNWIKKVVGGMDEQHFRRILNRRSEQEIDEKYKFYKEQE